MKELSKFNFTKVMFIISSLLFIQTSVFAVGGSDAGGGGTFVQISKSNQLTFWDLYVNDPKFVDNTPGDQIKISENNKSYPGEWIDYRELKSFLFLKERLRLWQTRARKLVKIITFNGTLLRGRESENADLQGFSFLLLGTTLSLNNISEISVPKTYSTINQKIFPGAFFDSKTERIFLNLNVWNLAGLKSQAACLLHERMRNIQLDFNLTNEEVQKIVYTIMLNDPNEVSEQDFDDNLFSPLNYRPSNEYLKLPKWSSEDIELSGYDAPIVGRLFYKQKSILKAYELENAFRCKQINQKPRQRLYKFNSHTTVCHSLNSAEKEIKAAVKSRILTNNKIKLMKLKSNGKWNKEIKKENLPLASHLSTILDSNSCNKVLINYKDPTYFNSYRYPLFCQQGKLNGTGRLYFETLYKDLFEIEIRANLSINYDAGSEIMVSVMGNEVRLRHEHLRQLFSKDFHNIVFRYDFDKEQISLILNDNGLYQTNPPLMQMPFENKVIKTSKIDFMFGIYNHSIIESVRLLNNR